MSTSIKNHALWHPCTQMSSHEKNPPLHVSRAYGIWLYDEQGQAYRDMISSWWVNLFGHSHPKLVDAVYQQLQQLDHVLLAGCVHEPAKTLASRLSNLSGLSHVFFASDGSSATEIAIKMAFHARVNQGNTAKTRFVSLQQGYHGETLGALSVTDLSIFSEVYGPLLIKHERLPNPNPKKHSLSHCIRAAREYFALHGHELAAMILEPLVQCAAGMVMYDASYLKEIRSLCDQYDVYLIFDEIATGFGRTGTMFAYQKAGILPDLLCLSKGITGGMLPLSCVVASSEIYNAFYHSDVHLGFLHSHSFTGNPLACRASLAVLDLFEEEDVLHKNKKMSQDFNEILSPISIHPMVHDFRNCGMIWAFTLDESLDPKVLAYKLLKKGFLVRPIGYEVYWMPPYVINHEDMMSWARALIDALDDMLRTSFSSDSPLVYGKNAVLP
jgi:adenosylmethionine-8-amino-7-oxononanoate aminotransferase